MTEFETRSQPRLMKAEKEVLRAKDHCLGWSWTHFCRLKGRQGAKSANELRMRTNNSLGPCLLATNQSGHQLPKGYLAAFSSSCATRCFFEVQCQARPGQHWRVRPLILSGFPQKQNGSSKLGALFGILLKSVPSRQIQIPNFESKCVRHRLPLRPLTPHT